MKRKTENMEARFSNGCRDMSPTRANQIEGRLENGMEAKGGCEWYREQIAVVDHSRIGTGGCPSYAEHHCLYISRASSGRSNSCRDEPAIATLGMY